MDPRILVALLVGFLRIGYAATSCPVWTCDLASPDKCLSVSANKSVISAQSNCLSPGGKCFIGDAVQKAGTKEIACAYPTFKEMEDDAWLKHRYCTENLEEFFNCKKWCTWELVITKDKGTIHKWSCASLKYLSSLKENRWKQIDQTECTADSQCWSNKCSCVPGAGVRRCETSSGDGRIMRNLFEDACSTDQEKWTTWTDYQCSLQIRIKFGHVIKALEEDSGNLPCLNAFTDTKKLLRTSGFIWEWYHVALIAIAIVCCLCCCGCFVFFKNYTIKRKGSSPNALEEPLME